MVRECGKRDPAVQGSAALCLCCTLHAGGASRAGAERRKFTQEFPGKNIPVQDRQSTKGTQPGAGGREDLDRRGPCDREIEK